MVGMSPDDEVVRVPDVTIALDSTGMARVAAVGAGPVLVGPAGVDLLQLLTTPRTVREVLEAADGAQAWVDRSSALVHLQRAGVVRRVEERVGPGTPPSRAPFDSQREHASMLEDEYRTAAFRAAVAAVVRPGEVVVDIGTGTGVLAVAAAQAGARRVYAIEAGAVGDVAEAMFRGNGVADRVQLVRGWSTEVDLPERADVVVSETIGSEPLGERILEVFRDARLRHARPGARFVPEGLDVLATPFQLSASWVGAFTPERVRAWSSRYATDFSPLLEWQGCQGVQFVAAEEVRSWTSLAEPVRVASFDLTRIDELRWVQQHDVTISVGGRLDALCAHFHARLAPGLSLSTDPRLGRPSSWRHAVTFLPPRLVVPGEKVTLAYRYRVGGADGLSLGLA